MYCPRCAFERVCLRDFVFLCIGSLVDGVCARYLSTPVEEAVDNVHGRLSKRIQLSRNPFSARVQTSQL